MLKHATLASLTAAVALGASSAAFAQLPSSVLPSGDRFHAVPGVKEFTGTLIVRPKQPGEWRRLGRSPSEATALRSRAADALASIRYRYRKETDEHFVTVPAGHDESSLSGKLLATGLYEYAEPNWRVFPCHRPNDPFLGLQWPHFNSTSFDAWDVQRGRQKVVIAITDTGVHLNHEDFNHPPSNLVPGYNSVDQLPQWLGGQVQDIHSHGTHCAGIAAAIGDNARGVAGVCLVGSIMPVRVTNVPWGSSTIEWLTDGILWAAQHGARITSTSYTGVWHPSVGVTGTVLKQSYDALSFWAAGNNSGFLDFADWPDVVIVAASDQTNNLAWFSNYGPDVDLLAPGNEVYSTIWYSDTVLDSYDYMSGTSMACPFAAGLAGLVLAQNPTYSAQRIEDVLFRSCIDMGSWVNFGWGRTDCYNAVGRKPESFSVDRGLLAGGGLKELFRVDNEVLSVLGETAVRNPIVVQTKHLASFPAVTEVNVQATATTSRTTTGWLELWNNAAGRFETVASGTYGTTSSKIEGNVAGPAAMAYVDSGGIVRARLTIQAVGGVSRLRLNLDQMVVRTLR